MTKINSFEELRKELKSRVEFLEKEKLEEKSVHLISVYHSQILAYENVLGIIPSEEKKQGVVSDEEKLIYFIKWLQKEYEVQELYEMYASEYLQELKNK